MSIQETIETYYRCWVDNHRELARSLLADDLTFRSPEDNFDGADAFLDACWKYADKTDEIAIVHSVYGEAGGYVVLRMGDFHSGELVKVRNGLICEIYVTFNVTH